jgi:hypothetical protein
MTACKITCFDKGTAVILGADVEHELAEFCKARGLNVEMSGATARPGVFSLTFSFQSEEVARAEWNRLCRAFELKPEWFGGTFIVKGRAFEIVGLNVASARTPVMAKRSDGKLYRFSAEAVRAARVIPPAQLAAAE